MKTVEIVKEEFKKIGLDIAEDAVIAATKVLIEKIVPRLALEADESAIKAVAAVAAPLLVFVEPKILELADKIDGQQG